MNLITILYYLFIRPLELLFETVFALANRKLDNPVLCIVVLSLVVNFLVLPLYKRADALQAEERAKEKSLEKWVNHIKKTFSGDERFLMLQYYYKQNDYKPIYALKSSVSLLLQIPFFIAAYRFLSQLALLRGLSFGPIADLSQPDALFTVGGFTINVLPIAMTLINIISGTVYSKGLSAKLKVQLYGVALVFLVLLYTSPAGLVFYWLLNNLFSLLKNVVFKLYEAGKGPKLSLPKFDFPGVSEKSANAIFWGSALFMAVFTGAFIPSNVIVASAEEFMDLLNLQNPAIYMAHALCLALGTFVVWCGVYYLLTEKSGRLMFAAGMWMMAGVAVLDYMAFGRNLGLINDVLQYEKTPVFSLQTKIINLLLVALVALVLFLLYKKQQKLVRMASVVLLLAVTVITGINVGQMTKTYRATADSQGQDSLYAEIPLSRTGKNVVLIMLDRALSLQVPYIFKEKPELYEDFDGFTYYSNVLSFGPCTSVGIS
nr:YidC/Oxa1 family membrane protein insertase [Lachnospiraceae bacterium]